MRLSIVGVLFCALVAVARPIRTEQEIAAARDLKTDFERADEQSTLNEVNVELGRVADWRTRMRALKQAKQTSTLRPAHFHAIEEYESRLLQMKSQIEDEIQKPYVNEDEDFIDNTFHILDEPLGAEGSAEDIAYGELFAEGPQEIPTMVEVLDRYRSLRVQAASQSPAAHLQQDVQSHQQEAMEDVIGGPLQSGQRLGQDFDLDPTFDDAEFADSFGEDAVAVASDSESVGSAISRNVGDASNGLEIQFDKEMVAPVVDGIKTALAHLP